MTQVYQRLVQLEKINHSNY